MFSLFAATGSSRPLSGYIHVRCDTIDSRCLQKCCLNFNCEPYLSLLRWVALLVPTSAVTLNRFTQQFTLRIRPAVLSLGTAKLTTDQMNRLYARFLLQFTGLTDKLDLTIGTTGVPSKMARLKIFTCPWIRRFRCPSQALYNHRIHRRQPPDNKVIDPKSLCRGF